MLKFYPFLHHYKLVTVALRWVNFICTWWINSIDYQHPEPAPEEELSNNFSAMEEEMLEYINTARAQHNLAPLTLDSTLSYGAYLKSKDMAETGYFNHNSPLYGSPFDMMKSLGISFRTAAENISKTTSVKGAHEGFMNSAGHRQNILGENFKKVGLGFYQDGRYLYVTQWFTD